jgi:hypothetical protein
MEQQKIGYKHVLWKLELKSSLIIYNDIFLSFYLYLFKDVCILYTLLYSALRCEGMAHASMAYKLFFENMRLLLYTYMEQGQFRTCCKTDRKSFRSCYMYVTV